MATDLGPFEVGQIWALHKGGYSHRQVTDRVTRGRNGPGPSLTTVADTVRRLLADPTWIGGRAQGSGRKRQTTSIEDKAMVRAVKRHRGSRKVTSTTLRGMVRAARRVSVVTVRRRMREAGLRYLRRRSKTVMPVKAIPSRLAWAAWVKVQRPAFLRRWVYTDGVSFFLSRTEAEHDSASRAALGQHVWREAASTDTLYKDCVGPSSYVKGQGALVRAWGLLHRGQLYLRILPKGATMNRHVYTKIVKGDFTRWLRTHRRPFLVQDHERALWCPEPLDAMADAGITVSQMHPKYSADLNPIENAWALLRSRLADTLPAKVESREEFIVRLRAAVAWLNRNQKAAMEKMSASMNERAQAVQDNRGHRASW